MCANVNVEVQIDLWITHKIDERRRKEEEEVSSWGTSNIFNFNVASLTSWGFSFKTRSHVIFRHIAHSRSSFNTSPCVLPLKNRASSIAQWAKLAHTRAKRAAAATLLELITLDRFKVPRLANWKKNDNDDDCYKRAQAWLVEWGKTSSSSWLCLDLELTMAKRHTELEHSTLKCFCWLYTEWELSAQLPIWSWRRRSELRKTTGGELKTLCRNGCDWSGQSQRA